jgi:SAM-dependent methyltransferase
VSALATQVRLRRRAADRLGPWATDLVLDDEALQQASRRDVARYRAARLVARLGREGSTVADLGCGLGIDARALAEVGCRVIAVERDPWRAEAAHVNLATFGERVTVMRADATTLDETVLDACDAAYVDPARRSTGGPRRIDGGRSRAVASPEHWSPAWSWVVALSTRMPVVAKVSPGFDPTLAPDGADIEWIDHDGETVEATVWMGPGKPDRSGSADSPGPTGERRATSIVGEHLATLARTAGTQDPGPAATSVGRLLIEPSPGVMRAGLVDELAERLGARRLEGSTWLTADELDPTPLARAWKVVAEVPHAPRELRAWLSGRGRVTWKTADTQASATDWERRVGHRPAKAPAVTIVITGAGRAFAVERHTPIIENDGSSR